MVRVSKSYSPKRVSVNRATMPATNLSDISGAVGSGALDSIVFPDPTISNFTL